MSEKNILIVEEKIGYEFENKYLLLQAFVRKSYGIEHGLPDNEVLELIGDGVLGAVVLKLLKNEHCAMTWDWKYQHQLMFNPARKFGEPNMLHSFKSEGELTEIKKALVQRKNLAKRIDELDIIEFIKLNQSDIDNRVFENASVKEDLFEAIIGAVALDCNWDMNVLTRVVDQMLMPNLSEEDINYVSELQEWSQKKHGVLPEYTIEPLGEEPWFNDDYIYDINKNYRISATPGYIAYIKINEISKKISGLGNTQSEARQDAARFALKVLEDRDLLFSMKDEIEEPSRDLAINQLEILSRRGYFVLPEYNFAEAHDEDGNPIWHCTVRISGTKVQFYADSSSKKDAKKDAAYKLLIFLLED